MESYFENVYRLYRSYLINVAKKILNNNEDAEDVVQKAFLKTLKIDKLMQLDENELKMYMIKTVKTLAYDVYNSHKLEDEKTEKYIINTENCLMVHEEDTTYVSAMEGFYLERVRKHLESFDDSIKEILYLSIFKNMTCSQIAKKLGLNNELVKKRIQRGKKKLSKLCGDMFGDY